MFLAASRGRSGARESRKAPRRRPPLPRRWRITTTTCPIPSTTCPSAARCVLDGNISDESMGHLRRLHGPCATLPWDMCDGSVGHRRLAPRAMCDGSMGHVRRLHGPQAAGKLPCATTLSSLDAAVVTRRRRRVTSFAFPSGGGAPAGASADSAENAGCSVRPSSVILSQVLTPPRCLGPTARPRALPT